MDGGWWPCQIEIRQAGDGSVLSGSFPYGDLAVVASRGTQRKERFMAGAFEYSVSGDGAGEPLDLLVGHEYGRPLASRAAGSLTVAETGDALVFEAQLPPAEARTSWMRDALLAVCLLYTSPSPRDRQKSRMPSSA